MSFQIIKDWNEVDYKNPESQKSIMHALQCFLAIPNQHVPPNLADDKRFVGKREKFKKERMQYFATLNDFPATAKEVFEKFHEMPVYDNGFEQIFNIRDYTGSRRDGFSLDTISSGLTFRQVLTGEKLHVFQMSGEREFIYFDYYGGALGWDKKLFENQEWWSLEENAIEFRNESYRIRAATFYALIEAVAALKADIAWQAAPDALAAGVRSYQAQRDAQTMNLAAQTILLATQASGYGISPQNVSFIVLAPIQLRGRIKRALGVNYDVQAGSAPVIDYALSPVITTMLTVTDHYWVILPKRKIVGGDRLSLEIYSDFDMLSRTEAAAGWMAFGGGIADIAQLERCDIA